jgi:hypothetical protein
MTKVSALRGALNKSGARVAGAPMDEHVLIEAPAAYEPPKKPQPSRMGTKPITLHLNEETRRQLKALAGEQGRTVESMGAEAFNLLFARYRKPEVAVAKGDSK